MKTLLIAFDGMDYELVKEFNLENIQQEEFGMLDNQTGIKNIYTSELFASFITGEYSDSHGIEGLRKTSKREEILSYIIPETLTNNVPGMQRVKDAARILVGADIGEKFSKEDLEAESIFNQVEDSRAMFVPSYNPSIFWMIGADLIPIKKGFSKRVTAKHYDTREYNYRKNSLLREIRNEIVGPRDFLMCHFHRVDTYQHLYGDKEVNFDKMKLRELYRDIDSFAGKVKEEALEKGYQRVIFMSDHGLPTDEGHNRNAFYSCNRNLFNSNTPKIIDFYGVLESELG